MKLSRADVPQANIDYGNAALAMNGMLIKELVRFDVGPGRRLGYVDFGGKEDLGEINGGFGCLFGGILQLMEAANDLFLGRGNPCLSAKIIDASIHASDLAAVETT